MIYMVLAMDLNKLIGKDNILPWHYVEDLKRYKNITKDKNVIMGYNTYTSLVEEYKIKKFNYKKIYVASDKKIEDERIIQVSNLDNFLNNLNEDLYIIGGKSLYEKLLEKTDFIYLTYILDFKIGNIYLDNFNLKDFEIVKKELLGDLLFLNLRRKKCLH